MNEETTSTPQMKLPKGAPMMFAPLVVVIVLILVMFGGMFLAKKYDSVYFSDDYHAVFLSNGQVYFSKIAKQTTDSVILNDVYYLRVQRALQPAQQPEGEQPQQPQTSISLVKLGNELHGPEDKMVINRDHVLFIEELKEDSKVVEAIAKDKEEKEQASNEEGKTEE